MKKFFAIFVAAAAMMVSCKDPNNSTVGGNENDKDKDEAFYGMVVNGAEVVNRGDYYNDGTNSYIVTLYKSEGSGSNMTLSRIINAEIVTPEVNDGIIPEGKYTIEDGTMAEGEFINHLAGSYYVRNTQEDGYFMLVTGGYFEVKHLADGGYQMTASFEGIDANDGSALPKNESRFEGQPSMLGLPTSNNYEVYTPILAQAEYIPVEDGIVAWSITLGDAGAVYGEPLPAHMDNFVILCEDLGENVIPQGTYPIDRYGMMFVGTTFASEHYTFETLDGDPVVDTAIEGYVTIKALGEGKYSIEQVAFGAYGAYKLNFSGAVNIMENSIEVNPQLAQATYNGIYEGVPYWVLFLGDPTTDKLIRLFVNVPASDDPFAAGIPSGTYIVANTMEPGTIDASYQVDGGGYSGSLVLDLSTQTQLTDLILDGALSVVNNGDGTFELGFEFLNHENKTLFGEYSGEVALIDGTAPSVLNFDQAVATWGGLGMWLVQLADTEQDLMTTIYVFLDEDSAMTDGIPAGTYPVTDDAAPGTIFAGFENPDDGGLYGSIVTNVAYDTAYDLIIGGEATLAMEGTNYNVDIAFEGVYDNYVGNYTGTFTVIDATEGTAVAPSKAAPMPLKSNIKTDSKEAKSVEAKLSPMSQINRNNFEPAIRINF